MNARKNTRQHHTLHLLARLANMLARPSQHIHPGHYSMLGGETIGLLAVHPGFKQHIDLAINKALNLNALEFPENLPHRLEEHAEVRAAVLVAAATPAEMHGAAQLLAAAILHKQLVRLIRKEERAGALAQLGGTAFQVAVREAFALYGELAELAPPENSSGAAHAPAKRGAPIWLRPGYDCLQAFVCNAETSLQPLIALRFPAQFAPAIPPEAIDAKRRAQILTLFRRKMPGWDRWIA